MLRTICAAKPTASATSSSAGVRRATRCFIVLSGRVKVAYLDDEDETIIAVMRTGDFFGELSVLDGEKRSADVVALETTEVLILAASDFHECIQAVPAIALSLLQQLAARVRRDNELDFARSRRRTCTGESPSSFSTSRRRTAPT